MNWICTYRLPRSVISFITNTLVGLFFMCVVYETSCFATGSQTDSIQCKSIFSFKSSSLISWFSSTSKTKTHLVSTDSKSKVEKSLNAFSKQLNLKLQKHVSIPKLVKLYKKLEVIAYDILSFIESDALSTYSDTIELIENFFKLESRLYNLVKLNLALYGSSASVYQSNSSYNVLSFHSRIYLNFIKSDVLFQKISAINPSSLTSEQKELYSSYTKLFKLVRTLSTVKSLYQEQSSDVFSSHYIDSLDSKIDPKVIFELISKSVTAEDLSLSTILYIKSHASEFSLIVSKHFIDIFKHIFDIKSQHQNNLRLSESSFDYLDYLKLYRDLYDQITDLIEVLHSSAPNDSPFNGVERQILANFFHMDIVLDNAIGSMCKLFGLKFDRIDPNQIIPHSSNIQVAYKILDATSTTKLMIYVLKEEKRSTGLKFFIPLDPSSDSFQESYPCVGFSINTSFDKSKQAYIFLKYLYENIFPKIAQSFFTILYDKEKSYFISSNNLFYKDILSSNYVSTFATLYLGSKDEISKILTHYKSGQKVPENLIDKYISGTETGIKTKLINLMIGFISIGFRVQSIYSDLSKKVTDSLEELLSDSLFQDRTFSNNFNFTLLKWIMFEQQNIDFSSYPIFGYDIIGEHFATKLHTLVTDQDLTELQRYDILFKLANFLNPSWENLWSFYPDF